MSKLRLTWPYAPEPTGVRLWYRSGTSHTVLFNSSW